MSSEDGYRKTCPFCGTEKLETRIGDHLYTRHWSAINELVGDSDG